MDLNIEYHQKSHDSAQHLFILPNYHGPGDIHFDSPTISRGKIHVENQGEKSGSGSARL